MLSLQFFFRQRFVVDDFLILAVFLALFILTGCSAHNDFEQAVALEKGGKHLEAITMYEPMAKAGDQNAQVRLMSIYLTGPVTLRNRDLAEKYAIDCAAGQQGLYRCAEIVALIHWFGYGGPIDRIKAAVWLNRAAELGSPMAASNKQDLLNGK